MVTLEQRTDKALSLKAKGYNCAQCVAMVFDPDLEAPTSGLGGGVGAMGDICGAANAMAIVCGAKTYVGPMDKKTQYTRVQGLLSKFADLNKGQLNCRELRQPGRKSCSDLIVDAITILHEASF